MHDEVGRACSMMREYEMLTKFWFESLKVKHQLKDLGICGRIVLKGILGRPDLGAWIGFIWFRNEPSSRLL
jgi:hypothetical protein